MIVLALLHSSAFWAVTALVILRTVWITLWLLYANKLADLLK